MADVKDKSTSQLYVEAMDHLAKQVRDAGQAFDDIATGRGPVKPSPRKRKRRCSPRQMGYSKENGYT